MLEIIGIADFIIEIILHLKRDNNTSYIDGWAGQRKSIEEKPWKTRASVKKARLAPQDRHLLISKEGLKV